MKKRLLCMLLALVMVCTLLPVTAFADFVIGTIVINYVEINGIDMPVAGELPDREVELPSGAAYTVDAPENFANSFINGVAWYDVTKDDYMAEGEVFVSGHEYYPIIGLKAPPSHKFANINSITGKTNLCDDIDVAGFYNADETQYICVYLGTMNDEWSAQPLHRNTITTQNCIAYNAAGEQITSALEGETVTVRGATSIIGQTFNGWILNPSNLQVTHDGVQQMHFVMPAEPVNIIGSYEDYMLTTVRLFFDDCIAGNEVDFTASNISGSMMYPGYHCMTPEGHDNVFYNGVAWWDDTDGRYLHPGDVYEANHVYQISAIIAADNGYVFDSRENLMVYTYPGGQCTVEELYISALDSTKHKFITSGDIIPKSPHTIEAVGGTAYDQYGNEITEAMAGDTVTLVADEPGFGWKFDSWLVMGNAAVDFDDVTATTTTFIMPNEGLIIMTSYIEAEKVPVQSISFTLNGYYMNTNAGCLQIGVSEGAQFVTNYVSGLDYIVLADNAGTPTDTQVTGALRNTAKHWIGVKVEPQFGYTLEGLTVSNISASFAEKILMNSDADGNVNVLMLVTYPARPLNKNTVTITNGSAYINNTAITSTVPGMRVRLSADEAPEGKFFAGWNVISGSVELADPSASDTEFIMGSAAVELEAVYNDYISYVEVEILEPQAGMTPSYLAKIDPEAAYERDDNSSIYCRSGVIWYDVDTEEKLDPNTAVFEPGHCYGVQILLRAKDGEQFNLDAYDYPAVTGYVNGVSDAVYVEQYAADSTVQVMLTTSFYIEEDAEIVPPLTQITITGIDIPEESMTLDYTPEWDYMEYISPYSGMDDADTLNGVTWTNITYENHVVMRPEYAVAARNNMYRVDILIGSTNNRIFAMNESGLPAVNATVNGQECDVYLVEGLPGTRYLLLTYFVSTASCSHTDISYLNNGNGTHDQVCSCGEVIIDDEAHTYVNNACVCGHTVGALSGMTMSLGNSLAANFVVMKTYVPGTGNYAVIEKAYADGTTKSVTIPQSDWQAYGELGYYFSYAGVAAKEMTDLFTVNIYNANGEQLIATYVRSIEGYCYDMLAEEEAKAAPNAESLALYVDILKYGAAAQDYFDDYNIGNLATARLSAAQLAYGAQEVSMEDIRVKGEGYLGATLSLKSEISMNFVYDNTVMDKAAYATISFTNHYNTLKEKTVQAADFVDYSTYGKYIIVDGMSVADCSAAITVTVYDADGNVLTTTVDSVESYIARMSGADEIYPAILKLAESAYNSFH